MKRAESKVRYFLNGLIFAAILTGLGACGGMFDPSADSQEIEGTSIGYKPGDMVKVRVSRGDGGNARSVAPGSVEFFSDVYEVVFRNPSGTSGVEYYRGEGTAKQGYVSVSVPVGDDYDVLFLAGRNKTLLAAGYATGVDIVAEQANVVHLQVFTLPLQWDTKAASNAIVGGGPDPTKSTNDFAFAANVSGSTSVSINLPSRRVEIPHVASIINANAATFTVTVNLAKFKPLLDADISGAGKLTIEDQKVRLWPRYIGDFFEPVTLAAASTDVSLITSGTLQGSRVYTPTGGVAFVNTPSAGTTNQNLPFKTDGAANVVGTDGLLQFELQYRAYGTAQSGGDAWIIRNGLDRAEDSTANPNAGTVDTGTGTGGYIWVRLGGGTPVPNQNVTVIPSSF